jgi:DNA-binding FadR family transcriptional regulator
VEAARLAATRRTDADIAAIAVALARRDAAWAAGQHATFVEADLAFHTAVVEATHNRVLTDLYCDFSAALRASIGAAGSLLEHSDVPHGPIAAAIEAGDPDAAIRATHAAWTGSSRPRRSVDRTLFNHADGHRAGPSWALSAEC